MRTGYRCFIPLLIAIFTGIVTPSHAKDKPTIIWLKWELTPEYIRSGEYAGQGFADKFVEFFVENLPEYNHKIQWTSVKRWHRETLLSGRCTPHIWGEFHKTKLVYSRPYMLTPPHLAIFHKRHEEQFGPAGSMVSIQDLLGKEGLIMLAPPLDPNQPRYPVLHPYLEPYLGSKQIKQLGYGANEVDLRLIGRGRGDFALGYPTTIVSQQRDRGLSDEFISYEIKEHRQYKDIHVSCFGDSMGIAITNRINELMGEKELMYFLSLYEEWNGGNSAFRKAFLDNIVPLVQPE